MIYIISIMKLNEGDKRAYRGIDTCSDSILLIRGKVLKNIILNTNIQVVNANVQEDSIILKKWNKEIHTLSKYGEVSGSDYVLLATKENGMYKIVDKDGKISNISGENLRVLEKAGKIANCTNTLKITDSYKIGENAEFENSIKYKYEAFIVKIMMLGLKNITFEYEIENKEVRLTKYTGSNIDVILPSFITSIKMNAFSHIGIRTIDLNEGLRVIGAEAFCTKDTKGLLEHVEIPSTVELICHSAFLNNNKLFKNTRTLNPDRFKLRSNKTIVMWQKTSNDGDVI